MSRRHAELDFGYRLGISIASLVAIANLVGWAGVFAPGVARAESDRPAATRSFFRCETRHASLRDFARSDASIDVYHGLGWLVGGGTLSLATNPSRRWTRENGFDGGIQSGVRLDSLDARRDADSASDYLAVLSAAVLPVAAVANQFTRTHDCVETWDMFGEAFESLTLALFLSEAIKVSAGRERPFGDRCATLPPRDANCRDDDRNRSFVSGHATLAAAGAGLTCRFALERRAFGPSATARFAPCALGITGALAAGTLRLAADRHWGSDVLIGLGVGALVGYFEPWGPLEWLGREQRDASGRLESSGRLLPFAREGQLGVQWAMVY